MSLLDELIEGWRANTLPLLPPKEARIFWQGDRQIAYIDSSWGPAIPYPPVDHGDGTINYGYVSLKGNAAACERIPEVQGWPEFSSFLTIMNSVESPIETVGCEKAFFDRVDGVATVSLGSYVDVIFSDPRVTEEPHAYLHLAARIFVATKDCDKWWGTIALGFQRLRHLDGASEPWGLMMKVLNAGRDHDEARRYWGESIRRIGAEVVTLPRGFPSAPGA